MTDTIPFHGEDYRLADKMGLMPLMRFAKLARSGLDSQEMEGLAAMYDLLEQCIDPEDWARFEAAATRERDQGDELMAVVTKAIELMAARPTLRSSDSSDGPPNTSGSSTGGSSSPVVRRLEQQGRAAQALIVEEAIEARRIREARAS